ncbi:Dabb family protein [Pontibacter sp. G13]|uniref:Dabb family protein n=1 Tax=Pontibacter sp. G13 TaxID=3074898 RepID=UPI002888FF6B|nr:Dabb family protein [Pontibacter sp. G13]WNJ17958.1 Dabb family protein [Pontibacter sp. G13]
MKNLAIRIGAAACLFASFTACSSPTTETVEETTVIVEKVETSDPKFVHSVYFWLKEGISDEDRAIFEEGVEVLGTISTVRDIEYGKPAGTPREVVDNSYDYAVIVSFDDVAGHDAYQVDKIHTDMIAEIGHLWEKVQIYDMIKK